MTIRGVAAALALGAATLPAQRPPDFSGEWRAQTTPPARPLDPSQPGVTSSGAGGFSISQNGRTIVVTRGNVRGEYAFDGSETTSHFIIGGRRVPVASRGRWDGRQLVISYELPLTAGKRTVTRTYSLDPSGALIVDETSSGLGGPSRSVRRYVRKPSIM